MNRARQAPHYPRPPPALKEILRGDPFAGLGSDQASQALLQRFAKETAEGRWLLRERVRRRAGYNAWRDTLVVAVAGVWMLLQGETLTAETLTTTLVLAYRASASLSTVVQARRLCLGNLPGYEALRQRRGQLVPRQGDASDRTIADASLTTLSTARWDAGGDGFGSSTRQHHISQTWQHGFGSSAPLFGLGCPIRRDCHQ